MFIRSAQTLNQLEVKRTKTVNTLIIFLQKHWRGTLQRKRYKKMIAALKVMAHYRKYKLRAYIVDLEVSLNCLVVFEVTFKNHTFRRRGSEMSRAIPIVGNSSIGANHQNRSSPLLTTSNLSSLGGRRILS